MQTIIGSGGTIGKPLARELSHYSKRIRLVSRNPMKMNEDDELFPLDVQDLKKIGQAIAGSKVVYVTVGFDYQLKVWRAAWPPFIQAVVSACRSEGARLVFFDNVYMYAKSALHHMTEDAPLYPPSRKGQVRKHVQQIIMNEVRNGTLTALIARSADFYGPDNEKSMLIETVAKNLIKGKKAQVFGDINKIHSYTFTPDAAKATALLGNTPEAFNQVWHLPTTREKLTTKQWIGLIAEAINVTPAIQRVPAWVLRVMGLFSPLIRELPEMLYQNEMDYFFDSTKFETRFGMTATPPQQGVKMMMDYLVNTGRS